MHKVRAGEQPLGLLFRSLASSHPGVIASLHTSPFTRSHTRRGPQYPVLPVHWGMGVQISHKVCGYRTSILPRRNRSPTSSRSPALSRLGR